MAILRLAVRLALVLAAAYAVHLVLGNVGRLAGQAQGGGMWRSLVLCALLVLYALLIALPFVPGVELGLALMAMEGPWIAPLIYTATVSGLMLAYAVGQWLPPGLLDRLLASLNLRRARAFYAGIAPLGPSERLELLRRQAPKWLRPFVLRYRYLLVAALVNLPGNSLIGGGGGILLVAGLSRLYLPFAMALTLSLAVLPVPLAIWLFDLKIVG